MIITNTPTKPAQNSPRFHLSDRFGGAWGISSRKSGNGINGRWMDSFPSLPFRLIYAWIGAALIFIGRSLQSSRVSVKLLPLVIHPITRPMTSKSATAIKTSNTVFTSHGRSLRIHFLEKREPLPSSPSPWTWSATSITER